MVDVPARTGNYGPEVPPPAPPEGPPAFVYEVDDGQAVTIPTATPTVILSATIVVREGSRVRAEGFGVVAGQNVGTTNFSMAFNGISARGAWQTTLNNFDVHTLSPWAVSDPLPAGPFTVELFALVNGPFTALLLANVRQLLLTELLAP
jgi:hypothetical protein